MIKITGILNLITGPVIKQVSKLYVCIKSETPFIQMVHLRIRARMKLWNTMNNNLLLFLGAIFEFRNFVPICFSSHEKYSSFLKRKASKLIKFTDVKILTMLHVDLLDLFAKTKKSKRIHFILSRTLYLRDDGLLKSAYIPAVQGE